MIGTILLNYVKPGASHTCQPGEWTVITSRVGGESMRIMRNALAALASVAVLVVAAPAANAAFVMTLSDGVNTAVVDGRRRRGRECPSRRHRVQRRPWNRQLDGQRHDGHFEARVPEQRRLCEDGPELGQRQLVNGRHPLNLADRHRLRGLAAGRADWQGRRNVERHGPASFACKDANNRQNTSCDQLSPPL